MSAWASRIRPPATLAILICAFAARTAGETLKISTSPAGAAVEINGSQVCSTPCELKYPGDYFHKPHTVFSSRLEHSMVMRITKPGFREQQMTLTDGPIAWTDLKGRKHGQYYILNTDSVNLTLEPLPMTVSDAGNTIEHLGPIRPAYERTASNENKDGSGAGIIKMESDPAGAEIYVDGNFVGQTPAQITLASGVHRLTMKAQGKRAWEKDLDVLKDSQLTLHPVLEPLTGGSN